MANRTNRRATPSWIRYGGPVIVLASLLELFTILLVGIVYPEGFVEGTGDAALIRTLVLTSLVLGGVGVVFLYVRYRNSFGLVGTLGSYLILLGVAFGVATLLTTGSMAGDLPLVGVLFGDVITTFVPGALINQFLVFGGAGFLAVGLWRTPTVPTSATVLMGLTPLAAATGIVGFSLLPNTVVGPIGFLVLTVVWAGAWLILGYHLWTERRT